MFKFYDVIRSYCSWVYKVARSCSLLYSTCSSGSPVDDCDTGIARIRVTPLSQLLPTRVCFTNAGVNTDGAEIHRVRKHAI